MNTPNLIIPGFPKSGTSTLFDYLTQYDQVFKPKRKEPHTYTFEDRWNYRDKISGLFVNLYGEENSWRYYPDASTTYMISNDAIPRISQEGKDCRFIVIARDPIDRIVSHYNWLQSLGIATKPFRQEIYENRGVFDEKTKYAGNFKNYLEFSKYGKQFQKLFEHIEKERILILYYEDLSKDPTNVMREIENFLQLPNCDHNHIHSNRTKSPKYFVPFKYQRLLSFIRLRININLARILEVVVRKKYKKYKLNKSDKLWLYNQLKTDIAIQKNLGLIHPKWTTVRSCIELEN